MSDIIHIIGHKSPDLDSVATAVCYAYLKNKIDSTNEYVAKRAGDANVETKCLFEKFGVAMPELLSDATDKKIILVDHNEKEQTIDGSEKSEIVEIVDHHKMKFEYGRPIFIHIEPIGATCTIVFKMFKHRKVELPKELASIMLAAILVDTVITKSPTCTDRDVQAIKELSEIVGVDYQEFGMEIFKVRADVFGLSPEEILVNDYKDFDIHGNKIGIGQIETVDLGEFDSLKESLFEAIKNKKESGDYHTVILFITDILKEGSQFLVASNEPEKFEQAFNCKLENNECYLDGILSRKKQVVPPLMEVF